MKYLGCIEAHGDSSFAAHLTPTRKALKGDFTGRPCSVALIGELPRGAEKLRFAPVHDPLNLNRLGPAEGRCGQISITLQPPAYILWRML
jgi:hypothetical protein